MQYVDLAWIDTILSLNQRLCGLLMVYRVVKNGLDGVGSRTQTVGDKLCLICMSSGEIW